VAGGATYWGGGCRCWVRGGTSDLADPGTGGKGSLVRKGGCYVIGEATWWHTYRCAGTGTDCNNCGNSEAATERGPHGAASPHLTLLKGPRREKTLTSTAVHYQEGTSGRLGKSFSRQKRGSVWCTETKLSPRTRSLLSKAPQSHGNSLRRRGTLAASWHGNRPGRTDRNSNTILARFPVRGKKKKVGRRREKKKGAGPRKQFE